MRVSKNNLFFFKNWNRGHCGGVMFQTKATKQKKLVAALQSNAEVSLCIS